MARKKIIFIIVEGPSDDEALGVIWNRLYDKNVVHLEIVHGDITSDRAVAPENIAAKIGNLVRDYAKSNHYRASDFQEVIHLIDMDGAFIPKDAVIKNGEMEKPFYSVTEISTAKPDELIDRNRRKSENINRICFMNKVWGSVLYHAYYMSSNLDHVLYNRLNSSDEEKEENAYEFAKKYKDHLEEFLIFISDSEFSVCTSFKESWEYIRREKHSLERHTNLGICFQNIRQTDIKNK